MIRPHSAPAKALARPRPGTALGPVAALLLAAFASFGLTHALAAQTLDLAGAMTGSGLGYVSDAAEGPDGSLYLSGVFSGLTDLDPGPGQAMVQSNGGQDAFLVKLDADGSFLWAKTWGGPGDDGATLSIEVDAAGNVYGAGRFRSTVDFDSASGGPVLTAGGFNDGVLFRLDADGVLQWLHPLGGPGNDIVFGLELTDSGQVVVGGNFEQSMDFDPGPGVETRSSVGVTDAYVAVYTSSGELVWVRTVGSSIFDECWGVEADADGNVYCVGRISTLAGDFDPGPGVVTVAANHDSFVWKLDAQGDLAWVRHFPGPGTDVARDVEVAESGELYVAGRFQQTVDFDPSIGYDPRTVVGPSQNLYIARLNPQDGLPIWVRQIPTDETGGAFKIAASPDGRVAVGTRFTGTVDLDLGPGVEAITSHGGWDGYVAILSADNEFLFRGALGGPGQDEVLSFSFAGSHLYSVGYFSTSADLDPNPDSAFTVQSGGAPNGFFVRLTENQPPVADAGPDQEVAAEAGCLGSATLDGSASFDADGSIVRWTWTDSAGDSEDGEVIEIARPLGDWRFDLEVEDDDGATATDFVWLTVADLSGPEIDSAVPDPASLWPPNHRMVEVTVDIAAHDACSTPTCWIESVESNEADDGPGDATTQPDWAITGPLTVDLRAERSGQGDGRIYTLDLRCIDGASNESSATAEVTVPRNRGR